MPIIDPAYAAEFAAAWCAAWNSGDLEQVFAHYRDDFEMSSPLIIERGFSPDGTLRGKAAIRPYWGAGITTANPPLKFVLLAAYVGVDTICIHYQSIGRRVVVEVIEFDAERRAIRGNACYAA